MLRIGFVIRCEVEAGPMRKAIQFSLVLSTSAERGHELPQVYHSLRALQSYGAMTSASCSQHAKCAFGRGPHSSTCLKSF